MTVANRKARLSEAASYAVSIPCDSGSVSGDLEVPENPGGVVLFAHGSGSAATARGIALSRKRSATKASRRC